MNRELDRLSQALRAWRSEFSSVFPSPDGVASLRLLLCKNEEMLGAACDRVAAMTYEEMKELVQTHPGEGLTEPGQGVMPDYAKQVLNRVCRSGQVEPADADRVEMMKRVLDYAKFADVDDAS